MLFLQRRYTTSLFLEVPLVTLKRGCAFFVERGNSIVFQESIRNINGPKPKLGDNVVVSDASNKIIGWGIYNPVSIYRVRMMQSLAECEEDLEAVFNIERVFAVRLEAARKLREFMGLPSTTTNAYRLVNGDGDRLSGVIVDQFDDIVVVHSGVAWLEIHREAIVRLLQSQLSVDTVVWRLRPVITDREGMPGAKEAIYSARSERTMDDTIEIVEDGVRFWMSLSGQKTGFYTDQRDNRRYLRQIARGKKVLDLCCYTGGFAINAALGDAKEVLGVDSSQSAIDLATRNAHLNGVDSCCRFECGDILNRLRVDAANDEKWDIVILDPPKLAFTRTNQRKSLARYRKLNRAAMRVVRSGGVLMSFSCSGSIDRDRFVKVVWEAADQIGKRLTILRESSAASDHVYDFNHPEGNYLKCVVVRIL